MINYKKPNKKLESILEILNIEDVFNEYNQKNGYLLERSNEDIFNLNNLIRESNKQKQHFIDTGKNFFMVIRRLQEVEIHKNGSYDHTISVNNIKINKNDTIDLKHIKGLNEGDYVEFYFDD